MIQIRQLTLREKTSQVSAYGGLVACTIKDCPNPANYAASAFNLHYLLCDEHKQELEQKIAEEETK